MTLVLIVEDGSVVTDANTYATLAQVRDYNTLRGVELDDDDETVIAQMSVAMDFLAGYEERFQGDRAYPLLQELAWPRVNVFMFNNANNALASDYVPTCVRRAQACLVGVINSGVDLNAVQSTRAIIKEVIGPLETDYSTTSGATTVPIIPMLDNILTAVVRRGSGRLTSVRV